MWSGSSSASPEKRLCRPCRRARVGGQTSAELEAVRYRRRVEKTVPRPCAWCGGEFRSSTRGVLCCSLTCAQLRRNAEGRGVRKYATEAERAAAELERWQRKNRRRRALKRGARSEPYSLAEIAERDRFCCGICSSLVDMTLRAPDRWSATVDHVVPIVLGGDDLRSNVQLAHFGCNSRKGMKVA